MPTFPGCPLEVNINPQVVKSLSGEILRNPKREIGGLLLGGTDLGGKSVAIHEYEPLNSEQRGQEPFVLSSREITRLKAQLSAQATMRGLKVVGCYRSDLGRGLCLTAKDLQLMNTCFHDPSQMFLLVQLDGGSLTGRFFFWDNSGIVDVVTEHAFRFDAGLLSSEKHLPEASGETSSPIRVSARWRPLRVVALVTIVTLLLFIGYLGVSSNHWKSQGQTTSLGLDLSRVGSDLRINWDPAAPAISTARDAWLSIRDGNSRERQFLLDTATLKSGFVSYSASSTRLVFRLEITGRDNSRTSESIIAVLNNQGQMPGDTSIQVYTGQASRIDTTTPGASSPAPREVSMPSQCQVEHVNAVEDRHSDEANAFPSPGRSRRRTFVFRPSAPRLAESIKLDVLTAPPPPSIATSSEPFERVTMPQIPLEREPGAVATAAATVAESHGPERMEYVAPVPLQRVAPVLPAALQRLPVDGVRIHLQLQIDAFGKVVGGRSLSDGNSLTKYLSVIALESVKRWRFSPGRLGGGNVASETDVEVEFSSIHNPQ